MTSFSPILVAADGSAVSNNAVSFAAMLAAQLRAELHCTHVVELLATQEAPAIEDIRHLARERGVEPVISILEGDAADVILARAGQIGARLIVIGTHGRSGFSRLVMGSVAESVFRRATVPVITISQAARNLAPPRKTAVAVDGSAPAQRALLVGLDLMRACKGAVELCYVIGTPALVPASRADAANEGHLLLDASGLTAAQFGIVAGKHVVEGDSGPRIIDLAQAMDCQMIALGTHGRGGVERAMLGSVAESVVRMSPLPVVVVR